MRQRAIGARMAIQIVADTPCAVLAAGGDAAPQPGLRVVRVGARFPAQQPVAAPCLVFFEHAAQLAGQRPRLECIAIGQIVGQGCQRRIAAQVRLQGRTQPPLRGGHVQIVVGRAEVALQRTRDEFAGREKFQIGRNTVLGRKCGLQPAPHRHLRNQHHLRLQQRLPRHPAGATPARAGRPGYPAHWMDKDGNRARKWHACVAHCAGCAREALFAAVSAPGGRAETQGRTTPCNSATRKMPGNGAPHTKHRQLQSEGRQGFVKK